MSPNGTIIKGQHIETIIRCYCDGASERVQEEQNIFDLLHEERLKAYALGKEEGEKMGYGKAKQEVEAFLQLLQTIIDKIVDQKKRLLEHLKPEIVEFAITLAQRVMRSELAQPDRLAKLIDTLLKSSAFEGEHVKILLSPEDLEMLQKHLKNFNSEKQEIKSVQFLSNSMIARGDVRIEAKGALLHFVISREFDDLRSKILRQ